MIIRINNALIDVSKIAAVLQSEGNLNRVTVILDSGERLQLEGQEAADLWRHLDPDPGWNDPKS